MKAGHVDRGLTEESLSTPGSDALCEADHRYHNLDVKTVHMTDRIDAHEQDVQVPPADGRNSTLRLSDRARREAKNFKKTQHQRKKDEQLGEGEDELADEKQQQKETEVKKEKAVFADTAAMKEKVRQNLAKPKYNVMDLYHKHGVWQYIAKHHVFDGFTLIVIAINAIWIAVETDGNDAQLLIDAHPVFQLAENLFCAYFSFEWLVRFNSFLRKRDSLKDAWFVFDSCMVLMMVLETWVLSTLILASAESDGERDQNSSLGNAALLKMSRLLRLSRMARMAKLLRAMPELMILIKGMLAACRSVFFTLCLLGLVMFVFGIAFAQLTANTAVGDRLFRNVPDSMFTLLIHGTLLDDVAAVVNKISTEGGLLVGLFFVYILLAALTVMNMLIGVLCEVVSAVAATEREEMLVSYVGGKLRKVVELLDTDGGGTISKKEFLQILENLDAIKALQDVGVDVVGLVDFADFIFEVENDVGDEDEDEGVELTLGQFMEVVLQLRGSNNATVKDVVDLRKFVRTSSATTQAQLVNLTEQIKHTHESVIRLPRQLAKIAQGEVWLSPSTNATKVGSEKVEGGSSPSPPLFSSTVELLSMQNGACIAGYACGYEASALQGEWTSCDMNGPLIRAGQANGWVTSNGFSEESLRHTQGQNGWSHVSVGTLPTTEARPIRAGGTGGAVFATPQFDPPAGLGPGVESSRSGSGFSTAGSALADAPRRSFQETEWAMEVAEEAAEEAGLGRQKPQSLQADRPFLSEARLKTKSPVEL
eukprot:TRINITY_DN13207_c1_g1_i1.p1 TRINITY_DN13207_c1_g1~~TRINITY_DN13207_c1_g1_i1.p1  ORF type:complete len:797 (-),score=164.93 TRINITY_DN13207_c1_g1_i1:49-2340(-)